MPDSFFSDAVHRPFTGIAKPHFDVLVEAKIMGERGTCLEMRDMRCKSLTDIAQFIDSLLTAHGGQYHTIQICPWTETSRARESALKSLASHVVSPPKGMRLK